MRYSCSGPPSQPGPSHRPDSMVSVIIATYNRRTYLTRAIESILTQTYSAYEIIVVDDGSEDDTGPAVQAYGSSVRYVRQENQGEAAARNLAIGLSRGNYVAFLDDDDLWLPTKLECQVGDLESNRALGVVACQGLVIDQDDRVLPGVNAYPRCRTGLVEFEEVLLRSPVGPSASLYRRPVLEDVGGFDSEIRYGEDWDLAIRVAARYPVFFRSEPLVCIRVHPGRQSDYLLDPCRAASRFRDHLRIVGKLDQTALTCPARSMAMARARVYGEMALNDLANGRPDRGRHLMQQAVQLDAASWSCGTAFQELAILYAGELARHHTPTRAEEFLIGAVGSSSVGGNRRLGREKRRLLSQFYAGLTFTYAQAAQWRLARAAAGRALVHRPSMLAHRGFMSTLLGALRGVPGWRGTKTATTNVPDAERDE